MLKHCTPKTTAEIVSFSNVAELPDEWDVFLPEGHFLRSSNLSQTENACLPDIEFVYVLVKEKARIVFATQFQVLTIRRKHLNEERMSFLQRTAWRGFTAMFRPKLLVAGHLFRHDILSCYRLQGISPFDAYRYYKAAIDTALKTSCASAVLVKDMAPDMIPYFQNHSPEYMMLRNDILMEMDINPGWNNIDDYKKSLKHKYAQRMRGIRKKFADLEIKELSAKDVNDNADILYDLYRQVCDRQPVRIGYLCRNYIPLLKQYNNNLKVWGIYEGDKMVAFFSAWVKAQDFDMFYIGFDYERNKELQLYFNILFFSIEQAIAYKKQKLVLGRTALDAKARLGCKPKYLSTFLYINNRYMRSYVLNTTKRNTEQEGDWQQRHPFKPH